MRRRFFWMMVPFALAGCEVEEPSAEPPDTPSPPTPTGVERLPEPPQTPEPPETDVEEEPQPGGARQVVEETETYLFEYSWPEEAGAIPELETLLERRLARGRASLASAALEGQQAARDNGFPFNKYSSGTEWQVVADLPDWLSLSATRSIYMGGAHPNYDFDGLVWDKGQARHLDPAAMFTSPDDLDAMLGDALCDQLAAERARRRGEEAPASSRDFFDACVSVEDTTILLGSRGGRKFDRIGIRIAPYVAGPYAEGDYEFTFPVTEAMLQTVRPQYRDAFAARN